MISRRLIGRLVDWLIRILCALIVSAKIKVRYFLNYKWSPLNYGGDKI